MICNIIPGQRVESIIGDSSQLILVDLVSHQHGEDVGGIGLGLRVRLGWSKRCGPTGECLLDQGGQGLPGPATPYSVEQQGPSL